MRTVRTEPRPHMPSQRRPMAQIVIGAATVAFLAGYLISDIDGRFAAPWLPRVGVIIAAGVLLAAVSDIHLSRRSDRIEKQLRVLDEHLTARQASTDYAEGYVDGLQRTTPRRHLHSA